MTIPLNILITFEGFNNSNPDFYTVTVTAAKDVLKMFGSYQHTFIVDPLNPPDPLGISFQSLDQAAAWYASASGDGQSLVDNASVLYPGKYHLGTEYRIDEIIQDRIDTKLTIPAGTTSQYVRGDGTLATLPTVAAKSFTNPTVTLNSGAQISTTRDAQVDYSVDISCSMSLTGGQSGTAFLEYADDSSFTTNVKVVARGTNANSGALTIGLSLVQVGTVNLSGVVPAGKYRRVRTVNNTGSPTFTLQNSQEVLL